MGIRDRLIARIRSRMNDVMLSRQPDFIIGGRDNPYLLRWWIIPRNRFFNVYLHRFLRSDDDRALHDHPWLFNCSVLLEGYYFEHTPTTIEFRREGDWYFRPSAAPHRVELHMTRVKDLDIGDPATPAYAEKPVTTLFITGPIVREWGFLCPKGKVPWQRFVSSRDKGEVGLGCEG